MFTIRSLYDKPNALIFYALGKKSGGGTPIIPPSGDWTVKVTDTTEGYFTFEQQKQNAANVYNFWKSKGWSTNPILALLGNMTGESTMNPGLIEVGGGTTSAGPGRGLVQWTPGSQLMDGLNLLFGKNDDWYDGNKQLAVMFAEYQEATGEATIGIEKQWYPVPAYNVSYGEWAHDTTHTLEWLVYAFMANYLRPGTIDHPERVTYASQWADYFIKG